MSITQRIDAIARIPTAYRTTTPPCPRSVKVELTGRCNYRCAYCALAVRAEQPKHDMDWNLFARIAKDMRGEGVEEIGLFYIGESFINPGLLIRAIHYLKDDLEMPRVFLTSNASLASPEHVKACMAAGLDSLKWSVNATESQFPALMGVSAQMLDRALDNIRAAWVIRNEGRFATELSASSIRFESADDLDAMDDLLDWSVRPYVDTHYWLPLYSMGSLATERERALGLRPTPGNRGRFDNPVDPLPCWACFTEGHVLVDGRLSACCFDATGRWVMGDLRTQSFMQAWHSPAFQALRQRHLDRDVTGTACEKCAML